VQSKAEPLVPHSKLLLKPGAGLRVQGGVLGVATWQLGQFAMAGTGPRPLAPRQASGPVHPPAAGLGELPRPPSPETSTSDGSLLVRHRDGDRDAFTQLLTRYRAPVYSYLCRCGIDAAQRDDLFQEVFLKVHRAAPAYRDGEPVRPWIFTIAANTVRSHFRSARVRSVVAFEADPPAAASAADGPQPLTEARETAAWLEQALRDLPLGQREVVVLCCVEQMPQEEAAQALGLPLNTLKTQLRRARLTLAQALARRNARQRREVSS